METEKERKSDVRKIRTHRLIVDAFFELTQEKSLNKIKVTDITDRAMVNRATFYLHFTDKYELFDVLIRECLQEILDRMIHPEPDFNKAFMLDIFHSLMAFFDLYDCNKEDRYTEVIENAENIIREEIKLLIQKVMLASDKEFPEEVSQIAGMLSWVMYEASIDLKMNSGNQDEAYYDTLFIQFLDVLTKLNE